MHADLVVVGAGHAGCEAAAAAARLGLDVVCITLSLAGVGRLSCNPAVGGLAKGQLVRELDALGGLMGRVADASTVQFRHLNTRKGLAVRSSRAQVDVDHYPRVMRRMLGAIAGLRLVQAEVSGISVQRGRVAGVRLADGRVVHAPRVVLTTGTFLSGVMHRGQERTVGGRVGDGAAHALAEDLSSLGLTLSRLKTGTVPRLDARTIAWDQLTEQTGRVCGGHFSHAHVPPEVGPLPVHVTHTHEAVHERIRSALHESPLYNGAITGIGPRYCPSVEDKVTRFPDKPRHLLFLEPEGHETDRVYLGGLSTSLPAAVQEEVVHLIPGLEHARLLQHGYAVEYDVGDPTQLDAGLQHREVPGLWLAGQVNGTSGYEEAAVQGLVAGVSAALGEPFVLGRDAAYIGVLVDDLTQRGVGGEPYRMFTSRAEHRLLLREDNADVRLMPRGRALGLVDDASWQAFEARQDQHAGALAALEQRVIPDTACVERFVRLHQAPPRKPVPARELLRRHDVDWASLRDLVPGLPALDPAVAEAVNTEVTYEGYLARARRRAEQAHALDAVELPGAMDWSSLSALSHEVRERLVRARPGTLAQVARLPGVTPAAVDVVAAWLVKWRTAHLPDSVIPESR